KKPVALNIRIVATSNRDMPEAVARGVFREDLYYRLNVFPIAIPALRQRPEDIVAIARHFVTEHGGRFGRTGMSLSSGAEAALAAHTWPGNIRELENVIQRALIMASGSSIGPEALNLVVRPVEAAAQIVAVSAASGTSIGVSEPAKKVDNMKDLERDHILRTLAEVGGSRKKAIERLGISERTLRYKLQQYRDEGYFEG
ncbi:MAG: sigma 54-interacting transcriptional regulator, partial [Dechloromonas sp.]|nr:sigma 54-interacting transcriptional regulator [Dechloromonas sp.]